VELRPTDPGIVALDCTDAPEMVALTEVAFPGFFRQRTCEMGDYFGIRSGNNTDGELIAMGGERFKFPGYSEISGLCTHPDHRGQGYAAQLIWRVAALQRSRGIVPWLHVTSTNRNAVNLYQKLGFETVRSIKLSKLTRIVA
jgi:predicted GNAT family acetyltransferase